MTNKNETPIVETVYGKISGKAKNGVYYYEGIPYGADTSGENRFLPPKQPVSWEGVRECTCCAAKGYQWVNEETSDISAVDANSPMIQTYKQLTGFDEEIIGQKEEISEDCLYLNVLTPATDSKKRPVLFYIHGGGFTGGSGVGAMAGATLAVEQDVVIVSMNERLGAFGYLYLGHLDEMYKDSGNVGMLDIVAALKWVQENITSFGGDPDNVTLIGESGGGMKICALLAMKEAAGLFHKAISISGVLPVGAWTKEKAADVTNQILKALDIEQKDFRKLLTVPAGELLRVCQDVTLFEEQTLQFMPVGDGIHIPANLDYEFLTYEWSKNIPYIAGSSEDENGIGFFEFQMTKEEAVQRLAEGKRTAFYNNSLKLTQEKALEFYEIVEKESRANSEPWKIYIKAISQISVLGQGAHQMIRARSESGASPCWLYNMALESEMGFGETFRCSWHTADLMAFFRKTTTERDEKLSKVIGELLGRFMYTGNPYEEKYKWMPYDAKEDKLLNFDEEITFMEDPLKNTRALCKEVNPKLYV